MAISMPYLELHVLTHATVTWGHLWTDKRIIFRCDARAAVTVTGTAVQRMRSQRDSMSALLRLLNTTSVRHNFEFRCVHVTRSSSFGSTPPTRTIAGVAWVACSCLHRWALSSRSATWRRKTATRDHGLSEQPHTLSTSCSGRWQCAKITHKLEDPRVPCACTSLLVSPLPSCSAQKCAEACKRLTLPQAHEHSRAPAEPGGVSPARLTRWMSTQTARSTRSHSSSPPRPGK